MRITATRKLSPSQKTAVLDLWNSEYPEKLAYGTPGEFDLYLEQLSTHNHYLLMADDDRLHGWAFTFLRNGEKWFAIIVDSAVHRQGHGSRLLNHIREQEHVLNGWVTDGNGERRKNGKAYLSPLPFYLKNGFSVVPGERLETEKLSAAKITWKRA